MTPALAYQRLFSAGCYLLAAGYVAFGIAHIANAQLVPGFFLPQAWTPAFPPAAYLLGIALIVGGIGLVIPRFTVQAGLGLAALVGIGAIAINVTHLPDAIDVGTARTRLFEPLAIAAATLVLIAVLGGIRYHGLGLGGRFPLRVSVLVFGIAHFQYAGFLAGLVPAWMPAHLGLVYVTGAGFFAAGLAIGANLLTRPAGGVLGVMFLLWVIALHAPRVAATPHVGGEWASLFVALALCGCSWIVAFAADA